MKSRNCALDNYDYDYEQWLELSHGVAPVEITVAVREWGPRVDEHQIVKDWVKKVRGIYYAGGKPTEKVVLGLVVDTGVHYENGEARSNWPLRSSRKRHAKEETTPIRLFQICAGGGHVLFYYWNHHDDYEKFPRCLADLLTDTKTTVAALGMAALKGKLEEQFGLILPRTTDVSRLAAYYDQCFVKPEGYDKFSVLKLADEVYRKGDGRFDHNYVWWYLNNGRSDEKDMRWWDNWNDDPSMLSAEKIETGTLLAFLVYEMAHKLLLKWGRFRIRG